MQTVKRKNLFSCGCCSCCCYFLICFDFFDFASAVAAKLISLIFLLIFCRFFTFYFWGIRDVKTHTYIIYFFPLTTVFGFWFWPFRGLVILNGTRPFWSAIVYIFEGLAVGLVWFRWMMDSGFGISGRIFPIASDLIVIIPRVGAGAPV